MSPTKRLVIALVFLLITGTIIVALNEGLIGQEGEETAVPTPRPQIFSTSSMDEVTRVQVKDNTTDSIFVAEKKEGSWVILEAPKDSDTGLGVDQTSITNALAIMPSLMPSRTMSGIEALATYGLGEAAQYTVTLLIGEKEYTLTIGSKNPGASDYYVQLSGVSDVYLVSTYSLDPVIELLTKPPYVVSHIQPTLDPNITDFLQLIHQTITTTKPTIHSGEDIPLALFGNGAEVTIAPSEGVQMTIEPCVFVSDPAHQLLFQGGSDNTHYVSGTGAAFCSGTDVYLYNVAPPDE